MGGNRLGRKRGGRRGCRAGAGGKDALVLHFWSGELAGPPESWEQREGNLRKPGSEVGRWAPGRGSWGPFSMQGAGKVAQVGRELLREDFLGSPDQ